MGIPSWKYPRNLESPRASPPGFDNDTKMMAIFLSDSRRTFIWRMPGTHYHHENIIERHHLGGAGVLIWGGGLFWVLELTCVFKLEP
ncbi:DDE_3 domain-containing protein [Trichonephila clavipes]|uniref:DDE_3 domain-containing protein n=1 Tax=Trichonephila clavipes TaxID=2585209 RepID=A0A8X6RQX7_TRICX|nr:DDE_3 domain-containing protein [Trichonephila clavipes]